MRRLALLAALVLGIALPANAAPQPNLSLKAPIRGLMLLGQLKFPQHDQSPTNRPDNDKTFADLASRPGVFAGFSLNVQWAQLAPTASTFDFSVIDAALVKLDAYNAKLPKGATLARMRLRIWQGASAPDWAKAIGGPIAIRRAYGLSIIHVGAWWRSSYQDSWHALLDKLAASYDNDSRIASITNTTCSSQTDEPFVFGAFDKAGVAALVAAGYTDALQHACLLNSIDDFAAWQHTRIEYPFNKQGGIKADPAFTLQVMDAVRAKLGSQMELSNHAIRYPPQSQNVPIYQEAFKLGPQISYVTAAPGKIGNWDKTARLAASMGAGALELWTGWSAFSTNQLQIWSKLLTANKVAAR